MQQRLKSAGWVRDMSIQRLCSNQMKLPSNKWPVIRTHYKKHNPGILAERRDEWAIDPYAWDAQPPFIFLTPIESWFWADARNADLVLYPQYPVAGVFVDFANPAAKVAIECDGAEFHTNKCKDAIRDEGLAYIGWTVYRITGADCRKEFDEKEMRLSASADLCRQIGLRHGIKRNISLVTA